MVRCQCRGQGGHTPAIRIWGVEFCYEPRSRPARCWPACRHTFGSRVVRSVVGMESSNPQQRSTRGGLAGAMIRRQATGGRGRNRGDNNCSPAALLLQSTGRLKKRLRVQLEGVPEMIVDVRKSRNSGMGQAAQGQPLVACVCGVLFILFSKNITEGDGAGPLSPLSTLLIIVSHICVLPSLSVTPTLCAKPPKRSLHPARMCK